jgi:drug/metabolite transporter (DMT)-like permease
LLLALVPQLIGHSSFNWALAHLPATFVSVATLGEPIGSTLLAYIILGEAPGLVKLMGAVLILVGIAVASQNPSAPANS